MSTFRRTAPGISCSTPPELDGLYSAEPRLHSRWPQLLVWSAAAIILFVCYMRVSGTVPVNSDGASNALQAWDIIHGNLLLHGWWLSDVSFYTTELPQYALLELAIGLHSGVVHVAGAMTYTFVIILAALLGKGTARGWAGFGRALIAAGIMIAPQLGGGAYILLLSPDHIGSAVPVLIMLLMLDVAPRRWYVSVAVTAILTWALVADQVVFVTGVLPLIAVCSARIYRDIVRLRRPWASQWYMLSLGSAALMAVAAAWLIQAALQAKGGYILAPLTGISSPASALSGQLHIGMKAALVPHTKPHQLLQRIPGVLASDVEAVLLLFGADFLGQPTRLLTGMAFIHVAGVVLAACAVWAGVRRLLRGPDLVSGILAAAVVINGMAYVLRTHNADIFGARIIAALLPFTAALAGRLLHTRMAKPQWRPLAVVLLGSYLACLGYAMTQPQAPAADQHLADWLASRHLRSGLAAYWQATGTTLASGNSIQVSPVCATKDGFSVDQWESKAIWYDPQLRTANFLIVGGQSGCNHADLADGRSAFGPPAQTYKVGPYTIMVWNRNLLTMIRH